MTTYRIEAHGQTHTRRSDSRYVAASVRQDGTVRWHQSSAAARRAAGTYGRVVDVSDQAPRASAADDAGSYRVERERSITIWHIASDGSRAIVDKFPVDVDESRIEDSIARDRQWRS